MSFIHFRRPFISLLIFACLVLSATLCQAGSAVNELKPARMPNLKNIDKNAPIQIHGDSVEYFQEQQKAVGTGHVSIDYDDVNLKADKITVYTATKQAIAEGNVVLTQNGSVFKGERAEYNFGTKIGNVEKMDAVIDPGYYAKAKKLERISETHYRTTDTYLTTCCGDSPFYKLEAKTVDVYPNDKVVAKHALLYIKGVPVFYVPYFVTYVKDFSRFPVELLPGKNSEWGPFLLSKWRYHLVDQPWLDSKGNILLDYRWKRGVGMGFENFYKGDKLGRGAVRYYYLDDQKVPAGIGAARNRTQWRHQASLGKNTTLTAEVNKLSDPQILRDFFYNDEYEKNAFPDNYLSIINAQSEHTTSFLMRRRLDNFYTVVERSPELRFDTHNQQFQETPFYLREEVQFSKLWKQFSYDTDEYHATRFDTNQTLTYVHRIGDVSINPHVGSRQTYYSDGEFGQRHFIRGTFDPGVDVSTKYSKTYDVYVKKFGLDYNQIRHIITPTASYHYRPTPTHEPVGIHQFDSLDALDAQNFVRFDFENKFQTKEHLDPKSDTMTTRDIARIVPFFDVLFPSRVRLIKNVGLDAELRPYNWLGIDSESNFDTVRNRLDNASIDFYLTKKKVRLGVGHRYLRDESAESTAEVRWEINDLWAIKLYERYEFETKKQKEFEGTVSRTFECVIADFTYSRSRAHGDSVYFALRIKAFPSFPFTFKKSYSQPREYSYPTHQV